jgi:hypothetical protein
VCALCLLLFDCARREMKLRARVTPVVDADLLAMLQKIQPGPGCGGQIAQSGCGGHTNRAAGSSAHATSALATPDLVRGVGGIVWGRGGSSAHATSAVDAPDLARGWVWHCSGRVLLFIPRSSHCWSHSRVREAILGLFYPNVVRRGRDTCKHPCLTTVLMTLHPMSTVQLTHLY